MRRVLALTFALVALPVSAAHAADGEMRIVVARDTGLSAAQQADIRDDADVTHATTLPVANAEVDTVPAGEARAALAALRADPRVQFAQIDHVRHVAGDTPDALLSSQWALAGAPGAGIDAQAAWNADAYGAGVTVAVVDSGVDLTHPDLAGRLSPTADWKDWVDGDGVPQDENGHGTHVAGIIAATRNNGIGIAGVAPEATIMPLRVMDAAGNGYDSDIAAAFDWAANHGAVVVNASLGGSGASPIIRAAIAGHPDTLFVVAAGNQGVDDDNVVEDPCDAPYANVLCVGASAQNGSAASFSNYGASSVDLFAPGVSIVSTYLGGGYALMSGTSMATPQVSGVAALALGRYGAATPTGAAEAASLRRAVDPVPGLAGLSVTGGRIDALRAVEGSGTALPPASATSTASATPVATPSPPSDLDGDGAPDVTDACPTVAAHTVDGCPLPVLVSVHVSVTRHRRVTVHVRGRYAARVTLRIQRRVCGAHGGCRLRRVSWSTAVGTSARIARRVRAGRYRVTAGLVSPVGHSRSARRSVRVR